VLTQTGNASCPGSLAFTYLPDGSIDTATDTVSTITYDLDYDDTGRVTTVKKGAATETSYTFNDDGQLQSLASAAGTTSYTYVTDHGPYQGMLESVDDPLFSTGVSTYAYDAAGRISTRTDSQGGAGITWTRDYELETSRVASQTIYKGANKLGDFRLTYDEAGNVAVRTERVGANSSDPRNGPTSYTYDAAGRLTSATGPDPSDPAGAVRTWDWTYDGAGNRTSETTDGVTTTWDLDAQGWPLRSDGATPGVTTDDTTYGWDRAGNLTSVDAPGTAGDQSFTLDAFDRITNATLGGVSVGYTFDAFSRTITRTQGSVTTTFTYEGISEILARSVTGTTATTYAHTPGGPLGERSGTATPQLYLRDLHSDIVATVDPTSTTPLSRAYYTPWGEPTWEDGTSALGFQSQLTDPGSGFVDMTTRSYVPSLGRFASQDIVFGGFRHPLSLNQWAYAEGDPVSNTDPLGLGVAKDTDPHGYGTYASDGEEPEEHGNEMTGTTTEQRIFEYLVERPVQAYVYSGGAPGDQSPLAWDARATTVFLECAVGNGGYYGLSTPTDSLRSLCRGYADLEVVSQRDTRYVAEGCGFAAVGCLDISAVTPVFPTGPKGGFLGVKSGVHTRTGPYAGLGFGAGLSAGFRRPPTGDVVSTGEVCVIICVGVSHAVDFSTGEGVRDSGFSIQLSPRIGFGWWFGEKWHPDAN
jgi:RHS repeat-associated protein